MSARSPEPEHDPREGAPLQFELQGRAWRATDPAIPDALRSELVHELMDARRAIAAAHRTDDGDAEARARVRVGDAKQALGERGVPWWDAVEPEQLRERLAATICALLRHRAATSTICPSDAARACGGVSWRDLMSVARDVAFELQARGVVEVRRSGARVEGPEDGTGPLRIARGEQLEAAP